MFGQRQEAGRVVEPAMQGEDLQAIRVACAQAGDADAIELQFKRRCVHAGCAAASAASALAWAVLSLRQGM
ncbi:hypothetical protein D9M71_829060 [compost metagenome]